MSHHKNIRTILKNIYKKYASLNSFYNYKNLISYLIRQELFNMNLCFHNYNSYSNVKSYCGLLDKFLRKPNKKSLNLLSKPRIIKKLKKVAAKNNKLLPLNVLEEILNDKNDVRCLKFDDKYTILVTSGEIPENINKSIYCAYLNSYVFLDVFIIHRDNQFLVYRKESKSWNSEDTFLVKKSIHNTIYHQKPPNFKEIEFLLNKNLVLIKPGTYDLQTLDEENIKITINSCCLCNPKFYVYTGLSTKISRFDAYKVGEKININNFKNYSLIKPDMYRFDKFIKKET